MIWKTRRRSLDLSHKSVIMGILNATPDSFSDGGKYSQGETALQRALDMEREGAEIIDIGGESTRPGASPIDAGEEIKRTIPLIKALRNESDVLISIDTSKSEVAAEALAAGADIVNDVTGFRDEAMIGLCRQSGAGICIMHMLGEPRTMQQSPCYQTEGGVVSALRMFFAERLQTLTAAGIEAEQICFDPGIGFGKTLDHNLELLRNLDRLHGTRPILLGVSRKSMLGLITGEQDPEQRDVATATISAMARRLGVKLHRVHSVKMNMQALRVADTLAVTE